MTTPPTIRGIPVHPALPNQPPGTWYLIHPGMLDDSTRYEVEAQLTAMHDPREETAMTTETESPSYDVTTRYDEYGRGNVKPAVNVKQGIDPLTPQQPHLRGEWGDAVVDHVLPKLSDPDPENYSPGGDMQAAEQFAAEEGWDMAKEAADHHLKEHGPWGNYDYNVEIHQEGRSGGWLVVDGIGEPDEWIIEPDACPECHSEGYIVDRGENPRMWECYECDHKWPIEPDDDKFRAWWAFSETVRSLADDQLYRVAWNLCSFRAQYVEDCAKRLQTVSDMTHAEVRSTLNRIVADHPEIAL